MATKNQTLNVDYLMIENVDPAEIEKFSALASRWWDPSGEFKPLHELNPIRMQYINSHCELTGKRVLDLGCGGGILTETLSRQASDVVGIDLAQASLNVAKLHGLSEKIENIT